MRLLLFLVPVLVLAAPPDFRLERRSVEGGAELLTVFGYLSQEPGAPEQEVPLVSVLRDTLDDSNPDNDRLRYIWVLTSAQPSLLQRATALVPFLYWRPPLSRNADRRPVPVLDLGNTGRGVWTALAGQVAQVLALDPNGALIRSSTRNYRSNLSDRRQVHLIEGLTVVSQLESMPEVGEFLSEPELLEIQARLALAGQSLGGLVNPAALPDAYFKQRARMEETRGHNWELLRQRAEANGLYFEPLGLGTSRTHAVLWVARDEVSVPAAGKPFDSKFLNIATPFNDPRVRDWTGVTVHAYFDAEGRRMPGPVDQGYSKELIPLALYSLEYPKVPLLVVDFRNTRAPKRREMLRRATADALIGVFGISRWGNWPYMAGSWAYSFVVNRRGATNNRMARLRAYSQTRHQLAMDRHLEPELKADLLRRLEILGVNPLQESVREESDIGRRQYAALLNYVDDPQGLAARINNDREAERTAFQHSWAGRTGLTVAHVLSLGAYRHTESHPELLLNTLDRTRQAKKAGRLLESAALAGEQVKSSADNADASIE